MIKNIYLIKLKGKEEYLTKGARCFAQFNEHVMVLNYKEAKSWAQLIPDCYSFEIVKYKCTFEKTIDIK